MLRFDIISVAPVLTTSVRALPVLMTPQNTLDLKGIFRMHPFAELLVEIGQADLGGCLRLSRGERKSIIYFRDGQVVYGVSNAREHRLLSIILELKKADTQRLARLPKATNDVEFAASLEKEGILPKTEIDALIVIQIERIIIDVLSWPDGEFVYSPLVKPRRPGIQHRFSQSADRLCPLPADGEGVRTFQEHAGIVPDGTGARVARQPAQP